MINNEIFKGINLFILIRKIGLSDIRFLIYSKDKLPMATYMTCVNRNFRLYSFYINPEI